MRDKDSGPAGLWRGLVLTCVVAMGLVTIVGSGGGVDGCFGPGPCAGAFDNLPPTPTVEPNRTVVQVGATATFTVSTPGITNPSYQWERTPRGGPPVAIPGATAATYTVTGANLADDGAFFSATVRGGFNGAPVTLPSGAGQLAVSSMPGVVFQDSEFRLADWAVATISEPPSNGPTHSEVQATSGGNPGAYRRITIVMPAGPTRLHAFHAFAPATYDPASQGAIYLVDFTQDCLALPGTLGVSPTLLLEQDGRRYIAGGPTPCVSSAWSRTASTPGALGPADFVQVAGPACVAGPTCPNFSAAGRPIRFGFANSNEGSAGFAGASGGFGIDNWRVTVWRR